MRWISFSLVIVSAFAAAPSAAAQTFVVDANGSGHFRDLPQAIAQVPSGAVLRVRPGSYSYFALANKSLAIIGDDRDRVVIGKGFVSPQIGPLRAADRVLIAHLTIKSTGIRLWKALGEVAFDDVALHIRTAWQFIIAGCANVHLHRVVMPPGLTQGSYPAPKIDVRSSTIQLSRCSITGSTSTAAVFLPHVAGSALRLSVSTAIVAGSTLRGGTPQRVALSPGGHGGNAIELCQASRLLIMRGTIVGGTGGDSGTPLAGGNGGNGIVLREASFVQVDGTRPIAGPASKTGGKPGVPIVSSSSSRAVVRAQTRPPVAELRGKPTRNQTIKLALTTEPRSPALLLLGLDAAQTPLAPLALGSLFLVPLLGIGAVIVPRSGLLEIPIRLMPTWPVDRAVNAQFLTLDPATLEFRASNSVIVLLRS